MLSKLAQWFPSLVRMGSTGQLTMTILGGVFASLVLFNVWTYGKLKVDAYLNQWQLKSECEAAQEAAQSKLDALNKVNKEIQEAHEKINNNTFDDEFIRSLQHSTED